MDIITLLILMALAAEPVDVALPEPVPIVAEVEIMEATPEATEPVLIDWDPRDNWDVDWPDNVCPWGDPYKDPITGEPIYWPDSNPGGDIRPVS